MWSEFSEPALVIVMFENRSFDHMLGSLQLEDRAVDGIAGAQGNPDNDGYLWLPARLRGHNDDAAPQAVNRRSRFEPDVPHEKLAVAAQIDNGTMTGFVKAFQKANPRILWRGYPIPLPHPQDVLGYYTREDLPVLYFLADQAAVCDRWFCSVPTSTMPNRLYSLCGDSAGYDATPIHDYEIKLTSVFDLLPDHEWAVYSARFSDILGVKYGMGGVVPGCMAIALGDGARKLRLKDHWHELGDFAKDARHGSLPKVTWIEPCDSEIDPQGANNDHPPTAIEAGQRLMKTIYEALTANPLSWRETALVITYDEHGGFYDHVKPDAIPEAALSNTDKSSTFKTFGPRVPALVLSPLVSKNKVVKDRLEHASILRFICDWYGQDPKQLSPRVANATSIEVALDLPAATPGSGQHGEYPVAPDVRDLSLWDAPPNHSGQRVSSIRRQIDVLRRGFS